MSLFKMDKIYPTVEELSTIETSIQCAEGNCSAIFKCKANLNLHLARRHGRKDYLQMLQKVDTQREYFCPLETCIYHSAKSFKNMKYLKQHFLKVHSTKNYQCTKCNMGYPTDTFKRMHEDFCGISFQCPECPAKYNSYDTLTTHSRRKGHKILPKIKYKAMLHGDMSAPSRIVCVLHAKPVERLILPNNLVSNSEHVKIDNVAQTLALPSTDPKSSRKRKSKNEMHTQTQKSLCKAVKSTAGTQTEVSMHTSKSSTSISTAMCSSSPSLLSKKSIKTQTTAVTSNSRACNTSFDISKFASLQSHDQHEVERNTLGTQTLTGSILSHAIATTSNHITIDNSITSLNTSPTYTDQGIGTDDLLQCYAYINDNNFCNMENMETQTDWLTNLNLLTNDVHSNNCTQTCDDILPPDLRFNNTHTQTVLDDILRSVGSQTNMRLHSGIFTNNETQTDSIFKELLQEINS